MDRTSQWIYGQAICKYVYPLLTFNSTLSNLAMDLICIAFTLLQLKLAIDDNDEATKEACTSVLQSVVRQTRYRFKRSYFNGVPIDEIRKSSPVSCMNDTQWCALVHMWLSSENKVCVNSFISCLIFMWSTCVVV
jgi:hypothetical protein